MLARITVSVGIFCFAIFASCALGIGGVPGFASAVSLFVLFGAVLIASADKLCDEGVLLKSAKKSHQDLSTDDGSL